MIFEEENCKSKDFTWEKFKMTQQKLQGKVIKISGEKSVKVLVTRQTVHPKFKKRLLRSKKYLVHD